MNKGAKIQERNIVKIKNKTCNHICEEYIRTNLLGPEPRKIFIKFQSFVFSFVNSACYVCDLTHSNPVFSTHSLQIYCFGLSVLKSINLWAAFQVWSLQLVPSLGKTGFWVISTFKDGRFKSTPSRIYGVSTSRSLPWFGMAKGPGGKCTYYPY